MEIFKFYFYAVLICVIPCLVAKPVSLNDIIAAESKQKTKTAVLQRPTTLPDTSERITLNKVLELKPRDTKKHKKSDLVSKSVSLNDIIAAESKQRAEVKSIKRPLVPASVSKSVSLNDIIAAESKQREEVKSITRPLLPDTSSLNKVLKFKPRTSNKLNIPETILPQSPLVKFRKRFQIKSPFKQRTLKFVQKPRYKRRYQSIKREIHRNEKLSKHKYRPLLRSLSELFDNMLPSDSGESIDSERSQIKLRRNKSKDRNESSCTCNHKSRAANRKPSKETTAPTTISTQTSTIAEASVTSTETPSTTSNNAALSDIGHLQSNSDVSILFTRDTDSSGRDDSRFREGSSTTHHTNTERNISGNNGSSKRDSAHGEDSSSSTDYEGTSYSDTRNFESSIEFEGERRLDGGRGLRRDRDGTGSPVYKEAQEKNDNLKNKDTVRYFRGDIAQYTRETELEMGRDEAESTTHIPQFVPGFRGFVPKGQIEQKSRSLLPKEIYEKSVIGISDDNTSNKRIINENGTYTAENTKAGEANATVISVKDLSNPIIMLQSPKHKAPYVTIIDGYSVARDKNGSNKLAKQSIRFHS